MPHAVKQQHWEQKWCVEESGSASWRIAEQNNFQVLVLVCILCDSFFIEITKPKAGILIF